MRRTLQLLQDEGLVHAEEHFVPHSAERRGRWMGTTIYVYGLTDKGVRQYGGKSFDEHSARTLDHELEISLFHVALKTYCDRNNIKLYWQQSDLKRGIHPDALFKLIRDGQQLSFFLEIEKSKNSKYIDGEPNIIRKLARYSDHYDTDACLNDWGFRKFRVIVVQTNDTRRQNLLQVLREKLNHRMFWLTMEQAYKSDITGPIFQTPKDDSHNTYSFLSLYWK